MNITKGYSGEENVCRWINTMPAWNWKNLKTELNNRDTNRHHPDRSFCIATAIENPCVLVASPQPRLGSIAPFGARSYHPSFF